MKLVITICLIFISITSYSKQEVVNVHEDFHSTLNYVYQDILDSDKLNLLSLIDIDIFKLHEELKDIKAGFFNFGYLIGSGNSDRVGGYALKNTVAFSLVNLSSAS